LVLVAFGLASGAFAADPTLSLTSDNTCYVTSGATVTVDIEFTQTATEDEILGGQFFMAYDTSKLTLAGVTTGTIPFTRVVYSYTGTPGQIDYAVGVPDGSAGYSGDGPITMATITFTAADQACDTADLVTFRTTTPYVTRLTKKVGNSSEPLVPSALNDLGAISLDWTDPTASNPSPVDVQCIGDVPAPDIAVVTDEADNCTAAPVVAFVSDVSDNNTCPEVITRTYSVTDDCGNSITVTQTITVDDTIAPTATQGAIDGCYATAALADAAALAATTGLTDNCSATGDITKAVQTGAGSCDTSIVVRVEDECGNYTDYTYNTRVDGEAPVITPDDDITVNADAGTCDAEVSWGAATAADNCDGDLSASVVYDIDLDDDGTVDATQSGTTFTFPGGTHKVIARATDACGNTGSDFLLVTVLAYSDLVVDVALQGIDTAVTRCIQFTFVNCSTMDEEVLTKDIAFNAGGLATAVLFTDLPCGTYDCVLAEDTLHTLQVRLDSAPDFDIVGTQYVADFTGTNALTTADYYDDNLIDIADFGVYAAQWGACYDSNNDSTCDGDTPCGVFAVNHHADANGDGVLDIDDFNPISSNFLTIGDGDCCSLLRDSGEPRTAIRVQELRRAGVENAWRADLNHDGWINLADLQLFLTGVQPLDTPQADPVPKSGTPTGRELTPQP